MGAFPNPVDHGKKGTISQVHCDHSENARGGSPEYPTQYNKGTANPTCTSCVLKSLLERSPMKGPYRLPVLATFGDRRYGAHPGNSCCQRVLVGSKGSKSFPKARTIRLPEWPSRRSFGSCIECFFIFVAFNPTRFESDHTEQVCVPASRAAATPVWSCGCRARDRMFR